MTQEFAPDKPSIRQRFVDWFYDPPRVVRAAGWMALGIGLTFTIDGAYHLGGAAEDVRAAQEHQIQQLGIQDPAQRVAAYRQASQELQQKQNAQGVDLLFALGGSLECCLGGGAILMSFWIRPPDEH